MDVCWMCLDLRMDVWCLFILYLDFVTYMFVVMLFEIWYACPYYVMNVHGCVNKFLYYCIFMWSQLWSTKLICEYSMSMHIKDKVGQKLCFHYNYFWFKEPHLSKLLKIINKLPFLTSYNLYTIMTKKITQLTNKLNLSFQTSDWSFLFDLSKVAIIIASPVVLVVWTSSTQQINPFRGSWD